MEDFFCDCVGGGGIKKKLPGSYFNALNQFFKTKNMDEKKIFRKSLTFFLGKNGLNTKNSEKSIKILANKKVCRCTGNSPPTLGQRLSNTFLGQHLVF